MFINYLLKKLLSLKNQWNLASGNFFSVLFFTDISEFQGNYVRSKGSLRLFSLLFWEFSVLPLVFLPFLLPK